MQVIIPLAGKGTRLRPHTHLTPKPLLKVAGRPVMDWVMDRLDGLDVSELILRTQTGDDLVGRPFRAGETVHIPPKLIHQIEAVVDSDVLEASTPELDDLVRLQDRYGRG